MQDTDMSKHKQIVEALRELERRHRTLLNSASDAIFIHDLEGRFLEVNHVACERLGYSREDLLQMTVSDIDASDSAELVPERLKELLWRDRVIFETVHVRRDGTLIPVELSSRMTEYARRLAVLSIARDITRREKAKAALEEQTRALQKAHEELERRVKERTAELSRANILLKKEIAERRRVEEELRESEQRFRSVVENSHSGILIVDNAFHIVYANDELRRLLKVGKEEVIGQDFRALLDGESKELIADRYVRRQRGEKVPSRYEFDLVRKDGEKRDVELSSTIIRDSAGNVETVAQVLDVTERKQAEAEREQLLVQTQEQAKKVQQIVSTVPEGVLLLNADLQLLLANPVAQEYLITLANAKVGDTLIHLGDHLLAELLTSPPKGLWHEVKANSSSHQVFEVIARPMENGPETEGWVMVLRDVTQERESQQRIQRQERLAAVGQLAAGIAHDFNNIMATIVLYAQMSARTEGLSDRVRERLETINHQAQHATKLIQQILDFSRCAVLERRPMDLVAFLKEQVKLLERTLPENIEMDLVYDEDDCATLFTIHADPTRMQQALINLAVNARDAMPEGGHLHIGLDRLWIEDRKRAPLPEMEAGAWVRVTVSDSGTGIPTDVLPHIFDPFFTTKAPCQGTGLGLAQVYGIVKQHEGHIDVATKVGKGTTFILYLPALETSRPETQAQEMSTLPQGRGETILVVEDNATVRKALVEILQDLRYQVLTAANGREALDVFERDGDKIALVVSDTVMPEMGGVALLHALREKGCTEPVIMLTGHRSHNDTLHGNSDNLQSQDVVAWLQKPVSLEQLAQVVAQALTPTAHNGDQTAYWNTTAGTINGYEFD